MKIIAFKVIDFFLVGPWYKGMCIESEKGHFVGVIRSWLVDLESLK